jgi:hypothetical protein
MLIVATVTIDGEEVGRQVDRVDNIHQMLSVAAAQIVSLSRDPATGTITSLPAVSISIAPYEPDGKAAKGKKD